MKPQGTLVRVLALAGIGIVAGAVHSAFVPVTLRLSENGTDAPTPLGPDDHAAPRPGPAPDAPRPSDGTISPSSRSGSPFITSAQAKELIDAGETLIDARTIEQYREGHIDGAFHLSSADFSGGRTPELLRFFAKDQPLVIYCDGADCDASENLAIFLKQSGYRDLRVVKEGFPGLVALGLPVAKGDPS
ncbi:MAG: rhodanese-like domain-containing protein [Phycisphaerae bacterium]|nr:rhodanese-like domain-containing protein [Phycisphaerae bacterium]